MRMLVLILGSVLFTAMPLQARHLGIEKCDHPSLQTRSEYKLCWDAGLWLISPNERVALAFGGRILYDVAWFSQDDDLQSAFGKIDNDSEIRRAGF